MGLKKITKALSFWKITRRACGINCKKTLWIDLEKNSVLLPPIPSLISKSLKKSAEHGSYQYDTQMRTAYADANCRIRIPAYGFLMVSIHSDRRAHRPIHASISASINACKHPDMINDDIEWVNWCNTCIHTGRFAYITYIYTVHTVPWIRTLTDIDTLSNLCLTYGYEASLHSRHIVGSEVYLSVVFFSIIWEPAAWHCACFVATDVKDLFVWSFKFLFFCGVETQADLQQTTLKTFQTVALSCATNSWRSWYLCGLQRSEVDFPMSVLMKIISRLNEYQADRYSVAANRQYGKCLGTSTARIELKHWTG